MGASVVMENRQLGPFYNPTFNPLGGEKTMKPLFWSRQMERNCENPLSPNSDYASTCLENLPEPFRSADHLECPCYSHLSLPENTPTLHQFQVLVAERTAQLELSLKVQAKLYAQTRRQLEQLRYLNQLQDEFLSAVSHELRTPLTSMALAIRMLRQPGISPERQEKYLEILETQCDQEVKLINDLLALQELATHAARTQATLAIAPDLIDAKMVITAATASFETRWQKKGLTLNLELPDKTLSLRTEADSLKRILAELLINAGKFSHPHTTVEVKVQRGVKIMITNQGLGIAPEDLPHIFEKFYRGKGVTAQAISGTGLGLALVKALVEQLGGTITATSAPLDASSDWKTCFTLLLPQS